MAVPALRLIQNNAPTSKSDALDALRRLAEIGLQHGDGHVREVARRVIQTLDEGRPHDIGKAVGIVARGGVSVAEERRLRERDVALRRVRDLAFRDLPEPSVAPAMILSFEQYEARSWPRDREAGVPPQSEPASTWHSMLRNGWRMPRTPQHLVARLDRPTK